MKNGSYHGTIIINGDKKDNLGMSEAFASADRLQF